MSNTDQERRSLVGTPAYDNWRAYLDNQPLLSMSECLLYTDSWLTGEVTTGLEPYKFFNLIPIHRLQKENGYVCASAALRIAHHVSFDAPDMTKTDQSRYHGGRLADEIAALASLLCGIRFRSGGDTRIFENGGDPQGRPVALDMGEEPILNMTSQRAVLPNLTLQHSLMPIEGMKTFPLLTPDAAIALVRSARLYQDALWLAESEQNLSWLLLVSAVETAATFWNSQSASPLERLRESRPEFVGYLESIGNMDLPSRVADEFVNSIGSTKKFTDFLIHFLPPPPLKRPASWAQVQWETGNLRKAFQRIYGYRSKALHDGMPFPAPMCEPDLKHKDWEAVAEKPSGLASSIRGGTWLAKDTPMLLHIFEYIARSSLNSWWTSMRAVAA